MVEYSFLVLSFFFWEQHCSSQLILLGVFRCFPCLVGQLARMFGFKGLLTGTFFPRYLK